MGRISSLSNGVFYADFRSYEDVETHIIEHAARAAALRLHPGGEADGINGVAWEQILRAAYEYRRGTTEALLVAPEGQLDLLRREIARLELDRERAERRLEAVRADLDFVEEIDEIREGVKALLEHLNGAWWIEAGRKYDELKRLVNGG